MNNYTLIYFLHMGDNIPFYIGKTINPNDRGHNHKRKFGKDILLEIIDEIPTYEWRFWEKHYINLFRSWGFNLINKNHGGGGIPYHSEISKKQISEKKKIVGYKNNELRKIKIGKANKGKPNPMKGKKQTPESIKKRSKSNQIPCLQLKDGIIIKEWESVSKANSYFKGVHNALRGRSKTAHGYKWEYKK